MEGIAATEEEGVELAHTSLAFIRNLGGHSWTSTESDNGGSEADEDGFVVEGVRDVEKNRRRIDGINACSAHLGGFFEEPSFAEERSDAFLFFTVDAVRAENLSSRQPFDRMTL